MNGKLTLFADDTLHVSSNPDTNFDSEEIGEISNWISDNKLSLNRNKTEQMTIGKPKVKMKEEFKQCDSYKYLGIHLDKGLTFKLHISQIKNKVNMAIRSLFQLRKLLRQKQLQSTHMEFLYTDYLINKI